MYRAWQLSREGISITRSLASVICVRAAALVLLTVIVAITLPVMMVVSDVTIPSGKPLAAAIGALTLCGLFVLYFSGELFSAWLARFTVAPCCCGNSRS